MSLPKYASVICSVVLKNTDRTESTEYFTKYPKDIPDYVKQSFPEGYTWERIMKFEVGVECTVSNDSRYIENIVTVFFRLSALGAY